MKVSDLRYAGVPAWPPAWTSSLPATAFLTGRIEAVLQAVHVRGAGIDIEVSAGGAVYHGLLLWDGAPSREEVVRVLRRFVGRPFDDAGNAPLRPESHRSA